MADDTLTIVRQNVDQVNESIKRAELLINVMREAGEDTTKLSQDLASLKIRRDKWENMLKNRGY